MENKMTLTFSARSNNESFARVAVAAFVAQLDPTLEELSDIKTALSEAVTNAIIHGYENRDGIVELTCSMQPDGDDTLVCISVTDHGKGIVDVRQAMEPLYTSHPEMERSGMGFTVMETFMDRIDVTTEVGSGTTILMQKRIHQS